MRDYGYSAADAPWNEAHIWPALRKMIEARDWPDRRAFDLGCGNGATCNILSGLGFDVVGVDPSASGIAQCHASYPHVRAEVGSAYDDLAARYGTFPLVVSLEVIEHCADPFAFAATFVSLIEPCGVGFLSTPYHGYWKGLALAIAGHGDRHYNPLWNGGHIKFFSIATLATVLRAAGIRDDKMQFGRVGRVPPLARSVVAIVHR